ncbi:MAG: AI-2E family transporter, partial [Lachnospiraceae bacterium]|nr:AI-2E family transporter [Lachnospiraceae bacterium]
MEEKNKYIRQGLTIFFSLGSVVLLYMGLANIKAVARFFGIICSTLQPILIGLALAYLLSPIQYRIEKALTERKFKKKLSRTISVFLTAFFLLFICFIMFWIFLPQLIDTIIELTASLPGMLNSFVGQVNHFVKSDSQILEFAEEAVKRFNDWFTDWMQSGIYSTLNSIVSGILNAFGFIFDIIVGFIVMIYVLFEKDRFCGQAKKILYAVSKKRNINAFILDTVRQCDRMFGGFISGKIIDSIIIGIICFIGLWILKMPYVSLISFIVGVTNVIPFFGPYIGAVPSALLILLIDPMKCIEFIIFIFILQQVDGNIIGPKILGESTGLSPFWVLFAILVFGELFGIVGMIIGVPLFATIYYIIKRLVESSLMDQNLPSDTEQYIYLDKLDYKNHAT